MSDDLTRRQTDLDFGLKGFFVVTAAGSAVNTINNANGYYAVKAVNADAVVDLVSVAGDSVSSLTIGQGDTVVGNFSSVDVTSGTALVYRR